MLGMVYKFGFYGLTLRIQAKGAENEGNHIKIQNKLPRLKV